MRVLPTSVMNYDPMRDEYQRQLKEFVDITVLKEQFVNKYTGIPSLLKSEPEKNLILLLEDV